GGGGGRRGWWGGGSAGCTTTCIAGRTSSYATWSGSARPGSSWARTRRRECRAREAERNRTWIGEAARPPRLVHHPRVPGPRPDGRRAGLSPCRQIHRILLRRGPEPPLVVARHVHGCDDLRRGYAARGDRHGRGARGRGQLVLVVVGGLARLDGGRVRGVVAPRARADGCGAGGAALRRPERDAV